MTPRRLRGRIAPVDSRQPRPVPKPNLADLAAKARASALIGAVVSERYRIVELLAMGGVGAVYLAEHVHMHKHVAIKVLHPDTQGLPDLIPRFEREAVAGAHIQHPNVAAATDFGKLDDGSFFLVLEYVRGTTLREVIKRGPVPAPRVVRIGRQIAAALGAAHAMGILHRDVKPRNVMLIEGERDVVKLIDFGLAKLELKQVSALAASRASIAEQRITTSGAVFGTIAYLAPESALGMDTVDARADLYALGLVLYELLAGKHPFDVSDPVELFRQHHKVKPPPIAERSPGVFVPQPLEAVVMRLLEKAPDARYDSAEAVAEALEAATEVGSPTVPPVHLGGATPIFAGPSILPPAPISQSGNQSVPPSSYPSQPSQPTPEPPPVESSPVASSSPASASAPLSSSVTAPSAIAPSPRPLWPYAAVAVVTAGLVLGVGALFNLGGRSADSPPAASTAAPAVALVSAAPMPQPPAVPTLSASVAATTPEAVSAAAPPTTPTASAAPFDTAAARATLRRASSGHDWQHATEAFFTLAEHDPAALHDPALMAAARDTAAAAGVAGGAGADRLFVALGERFGSDGVDVLYEIVRTRGGSKAAVRAQEMLRQTPVIARATPELRITVTLRDAPCPDQTALLDRAAADGDVRTLVVLQTISTSCLGKSGALENALKALRLRLRPH